MSHFARVIVPAGKKVTIRFNAPIATGGHDRIVLYLDESPDADFRALVLEALDSFVFDQKPSTESSQ